MKTLTLSLILFSSCLYAGEVYKCKDQAGKTLYQDTPCQSGKQEVLNNLPKNSIKGPTPNPQLVSPASEIKPTPIVKNVDAAPTPRFSTDPNAPITENCSLDNPNRDPEFCRTSNLPINNTAPNSKLPIRPRALPAPRSK
ncbi:DUF4124 domain-containing protein [Chitinibacter bivalviorum]|uniref:DUF4124 domain-containing protein n=1 Tax=Chitinibacter bivalviorum TaxID=2739434 RepID=A0A7H9BGM1_9NEIS|nr:DUF4124 domain-containing protein [Chitinibacter bivalviorum]QLG87873.1 DUF4124 domain-containing protein [Chitinibacter bivalviorum]